MILVIPGAVGCWGPQQLDPEYVYDEIIWFFGSWQQALDNLDGQAVIERYLPQGFLPPETGSGEAE
ncbi:hypothetical protein [Nonomuraea sediminis]|uniref:hypothetical protein n=1 Tax=Nonomuraea sediminis TaxID=2835864 RepID=UPI001BDD17EC|nr:hypothetical protein [Nonomuraea sediminis]